MLRSLVGSEMCIRDRGNIPNPPPAGPNQQVLVQYPANIPQMDNIPNPPPQDQDQPNSEPPDQEDPQVEDPQSYDLPPEDTSLPQTEEEDFPSDISPAGSEDSEGSFKTVEQTPPPQTPEPRGRSLQRDPLADPDTSTPFNPPVASTPMVPSHTGTIPKTRQVDTQIGPGASTSAGNTPRLPVKTYGALYQQRTPQGQLPVHSTREWVLK